VKVTGAGTVHAPAGRVWAALRDPAVLARALPGCERAERTGPGRARLDMSGGTGAARGTYAAEVWLVGGEPPGSFRLRVHGAGTAGSVSAEVAVRLAGTGDGGTELSYQADATVAGMLAGTGQLLLASMASRTASEFFARLDRVLAAEPGMVAGEPGTVAGEPGTVAGGAGAEQAGRPGGPGRAGGDPWGPLPGVRRDAGSRQRDARAPAALAGFLVGSAAGLAAGALAARRRR
jgi:carbon monoxide dehydrogenase subunit G